MLIIFFDQGFNYFSSFLILLFRFYLFLRPKSYHYAHTKFFLLLFYLFPTSNYSVRLFIGLLFIVYDLLNQLIKLFIRIPTLPMFLPDRHSKLKNSLVLPFLIIYSTYLGLYCSHLTIYFIN